METKFTRGPWRAVFIQDGEEVKLEGLVKGNWYHSEVSTENGEDTIADADYYSDEDAANFVLMAAAPDMYAVLFKIRALVVLRQEMGQLDVQTVQGLLSAMGKAEGV